MTEEKKETFGNFDFAKALEFLNLFPYQKWNIQVKSIQPSESLVISLFLSDFLSDRQEIQQEIPKKIT